MIKNLKELRNEKGISQQALANILGISQQSVNKYENHDVEPDITTLIAIADYFTVTLDYLVGREDNNKSDAQICCCNKEIQLVSAYRCLTKSEQNCVDILLRTFNENNKSKGSS